MEGRNGSVVALDPRNGDVLAMVSRPRAKASGESCRAAERIPMNDDAQRPTVTSVAASASMHSRSPGTGDVTSSVAILSETRQRLVL